MPTPDDQRSTTSKKVVDPEAGLPRMAPHICPLLEGDVEHAQELIRRVAPGRDGAWLTTTTPLIQKSPNGRLLGAFASENERRLIAFGSITESMHDFCHVGLNLIAVDPEYVASPEVKDLVGRMVSDAESLHPLPQGQDLSGLPSNDTLSRRFFASSVGTAHPRLFEGYGFHSVHRHQQQDGSELHWMMKV